MPLHDQGVRVYVDIVFNHMANEKGRRVDPYHFPGEDELERYRGEREAVRKRPAVRRSERRTFQPLGLQSGRGYLATGTISTNHRNIGSPASPIWTSTTGYPAAADLPAPP